MSESPTEGPSQADNPTSTGGSPAVEAAPKKKRDIRERMEAAVISDWWEVGSPDLVIFQIRRPDGQPFFEFDAGQYAQLASWQQGEEDTRPRQYSIASSPLERDHLEFYVILVRDELPDGGERLGTFTGVLWQLKEGAEVLYMGPAGRFTLDRTEQEDVVLVSTGTGLAPYISMAKELWSDYQKTGEVARRLTVVHGVSYARDLGYRELLEEMSRDPDFGLLYVPTVSRPEQDDEWTPELGRGRANDLVRLLLGHEKSGRVEPALPEGIDPRELERRIGTDRTAFYLCGNPGMIADSKEVLAAEGYVVDGKGRQVLTEDYW